MLGIQLFVPTLEDYQEKDGYSYGECIDLAWTDPHSPHVETLIHQGFIYPEIVDGNYYFYPEKPMTRKEAALWLYCLLDLGQVNQNQTIFSDINNLDQSYQIAIRKTHQAGIFEGLFLGNSFLPDHLLSGKEAILILEQAYGKRKKLSCDNL